MPKLSSAAPWLVLALVAACKPPVQEQQHAVEAAAPSQVEPVPPHAAVVSVESVTNLLAVVPSTLTVSSAVRNPRDFPEHLIDGDPETAWNGKTGDLVGATIRFRVPDDSHVDAVELTAGYVRISGDRDLFTMNHRIQQVALRRNGELLGSRRLDVNARGLQRLPIDRAGGEFTIEVEETLPGSEKRWREVVVSELRVVGKPGAQRRTAEDRLLVGVGETQPEPPAHDGLVELSVSRLPASLLAPQPSIDVLCRKFMAWARLEAPKQEAELAPWNDAAPVPTPRCEEEPLPSPLVGSGAPWRGVRALHLAWAYDDAVFLVGELAEGLRLTPIRYRDRYGNGMGCGPVWTRDWLHEVRIEQGWLVASIDGMGPMLADSPIASAHQRGLAMCRLRVGALHCLELNPQYSEPLAYKEIADASDRSARPVGVPWLRETAFHVDGDGHVLRANP